MNPTFLVDAVISSAKLTVHSRVPRSSVAAPSELRGGTSSSTGVGYAADGGVVGLAEGWCFYDGRRSSEKGVRTKKGRWKGSLPVFFFCIGNCMFYMIFA